MTMSLENPPLRAQVVTDRLSVPEVLAIVRRHPARSAKSIRRGG